METASNRDFRRLVEIRTTCARRGVSRAFTVILFATLALARPEPFLFIGYLVSGALFGPYRVLLMASAGGARNDARKLVETNLQERGTELRAATVAGDREGDPLEGTPSAAVSPVIRVTTLLGLLAVELGRTTSAALAAVLLAASIYLVWRSFYAARIRGAEARRRGRRAVGSPPPTPFRRRVLGQGPVRRRRVGTQDLIRSTKRCWIISLQAGARGRRASGTGVPWGRCWSTPDWWRCSFGRGMP